MHLDISGVKRLPPRGMTSSWTALQFSVPWPQTDMRQAALCICGASTAWPPVKD